MSTARSREIGTKQSIPKELRYTFEDFNRKFPDDDTCLEYVKEQRFPGGMAPCEKCGEETKHHRISGRTAYSCQFCGTQVYPLAGTVFEHSSTSLRIWFYAVYLMGSTRCGISAKQIQRETGVTYKTAWRMFRQIRTLLSEDLQLEGPTVEMDETYFGGKRTGRRGRPPAHDGKKIGITGIAQRRGKVVAKAMPVVDTDSLMGMAKQHILPASTVFTDEAPMYNPLLRHGYQHYRTHHSAGVYVAGIVQINNIEGFWSLIKRGIWWRVSRR